MSTRGLIGFRIDGVDKVTYNHSDSYPSWLGKQTLEFFRSADAVQLASAAARIKLVDEDRKPTKRQREAVAQYLQLDSDDGRSDWYSLLREAQGEWDYWYRGLPYMIDYQGFFYGFGCEWCYVYDVDTQMLEIYSNAYEERGLGRYNRRDGTGEDETIGVRLLMTVPLATIQGLTDDQIDFLCQFLTKQDEAQWYERGGGAKVAATSRPAKGMKGTTDWCPYAPGWDIQISIDGMDSRCRLRMGESLVDATIGDGLDLSHSGYGEALQPLLVDEVRQFAIAIYGDGATMAHYRKVMTFRKALSQFDLDTAGWPLLAIGLSGDNPDLKLRLTASYFEKLKSALTERGLTNQAWKFMLGQPRESLAALIAELGFNYRLGKTIKLLNVFAEAMQTEHLVPHRIEAGLAAVERICGITGYSSAAGWSESADPARHDQAKAFIRALMREAESDVQHLDVIASDIADYVRTADAATLDGATWKSLKRRSDGWHLRVALEKAEAENRTWEAKLGVYAAGEYLALELTTRAMLAEEGVEMHHCVGSYSEDCERGSSVIFSLQKGGEREATVELRRSDDSAAWNVAQVRGRYNATYAATSAVMAAARALADACTLAAAKPRSRTAADRATPQASVGSMQLSLF